LALIPFWDDVLAAFDPVAEAQRHRFLGPECFFDEDERRQRLQD